MVCEQLHESCQDINKSPEPVIVCNNVTLQKFTKYKTNFAIICCIKVICAYKKPSYVFTWQLYVFL
jgi:hypothetical protein